MVFIAASITFALDQLTKYFINNRFSLHESLPIIKGVFHLTLVHNRGAAFGLLQNQIPFLILTSIFAIYLIYSNLKAGKHGKIYSLALGLILAGAAGNLIDRIFLGYVIDFLDFRIWPVFNLADSAITVGAGLLGYSIISKR
ncbi:MAG TPA: signal peptidase II [Candidatus Margulisiibacteriota bacterium]|nr:signal peptidase II [Candidatus Margulisiibacteriota bacterium]